jgi:hypothetical protein
VLVTLSGFPGSGKSELARYLVDNHGFELVKFASPLKNMLRAVGLSEDEIEGGRKESPCGLLGGKTPRHAMETLGMWGREQIHPRLWINLASSHIMSELSAGIDVVVDDLRFPNEEQEIDMLGGIKIYVKRPSMPKPSTVHESEKHYGKLNFDHLIENNSNLPRLYYKMLEILREENAKGNY